MRDEGMRADVPTSEISADVIDALIKELGDVEWYVAQIADQIKVTLGTVLNMNLLKLADRKERGVLGGSGDDR
jgi:NTP pyrophosphatase (non-canonical NTP hydrolase)